jgi:hypothetical protein
MRSSCLSSAILVFATTIDVALIKHEQKFGKRLGSGGGFALG